jgi:uncharacterized protein YlzI (FlbEa/FlbD family)
VLLQGGENLLNVDHIMQIEDVPSGVHIARSTVYLLSLSENKLESTSMQDS